MGCGGSSEVVVWLIPSDHIHIRFNLSIVDFVAKLPHWVEAKYAASYEDRWDVRRVEHFKLQSSRVVLTGSDRECATGRPFFTWTIGDHRAYGNSPEISKVSQQKVQKNESHIS